MGILPGMCKLCFWLGFAGMFPVGAIMASNSVQAICSVRTGGTTQGKLLSVTTLPVFIANAVSIYIFSNFVVGSSAGLVSGMMFGWVLLTGGALVALLVNIWIKVYRSQSHARLSCGYVLIDY